MKCPPHHFKKYFWGRIPKSLVKRSHNPQRLCLIFCGCREVQETLLNMNLIFLGTNIQPKLNKL
jgi:hypothetical protein